MNSELICVILLVLCALWSVMTVRLLRAVVGLAVTSVMLSIIMFRLNAPLAAVFELSVCAGLIPVMFITTVSFTQRLTKERMQIRARERFLKFWSLPFIVAIVGVLLIQYLKKPLLVAHVAAETQGAREVLWYARHIDLLGQVIILLAGAFGVILLFKELRHDA